MSKHENKHTVGVFPAATISQLEHSLEERQNKDRRQSSRPIDFEERRKRQRRVTKEN